MRWIGYVGIYPPRYHRIPRSSRCMNSEYAIMRKLVYAFEKGRNLVTSPNLSASPPISRSRGLGWALLHKLFPGVYLLWILLFLYSARDVAPNALPNTQTGLPCNVTASRIPEAPSRWNAKPHLQSSPYAVERPCRNSLVHPIQSYVDPDLSGTRNCYITWIRLCPLTYSGPSGNGEFISARNM